MAEVTCEGVWGQLSAHQDDELSVTDRIRVDGHLSGCVACAREVEAVRAVSGALPECAPQRLDEETYDRVGGAGRLVLVRLNAERTVAES